MDGAYRATMSAVTQGRSEIFFTATGLETDVNWYFSVTAVDIGGNETAFSNEHVDPVAGTIDMRVHDAEELCWGADGCTPTDRDTPTIRRRRRHGRRTRSPLRPSLPGPNRTAYQ